MSVMATPKTPLPIDVDLYAGGDWRAIPGDVYQRDDISIQHGLSNEATSVQPCQMGMTLGNLAGNYDPTNATGPYYGTIGRNTPIRVSIRSDVDQFNRTVSNGWGTSTSTNAADPTGDAWQNLFVGGNSAASFAVSGGSGTHTVAGTGAWVMSHTTASWGDVDVAVTVNVLPFVNVTGAQIEPANIVLRGQDSTHYYMVRVAINTSQLVTLQLFDAAGFGMFGPIATTVAHVGSNSIRVRAQAEGSTIRAKVWDTATSEPSGWTFHVNYYESIVLAGAQALDAPGWVGMRSGVASGNTNTNPITFTYTNLVVRVPRFSGWAFLQPTSDITGKDQIVKVTAGSVLRQLSQGQLPISSPLRHDIPTLPNLLAYWPCEDGTAATSFASGLSNGQPMQIAAGTPQLASDSTFIGSSPLPVNNGSYWLGYTGSTDTSGVVQVRFLFKFPPAATLVNGTVLARAHTTGSVVRWDLVYNTVGSIGLQVNAFDTNGNLVSGSPFGIFVPGAPLDGNAFRVGISMQLSGSNIACQVQTYLQGGAPAGAFTFTVTGQSITTCYAVAICPPGNNIAQSVVGHITFENVVTNINDLIGQVNAFVGEDAGSRLSRLCGYANIPLAFVGDTTALSLDMGPQTADQLYNLIQATATSDAGLLYETKGDAALAYRTGGGHACGPTEPVAVALSRTLHQLADPPVATYDDQNLHNDYTITNGDGSTIQVTQTTGPLSTALPPAGMGDYATSAQVNLSTSNEVADVANWLLHLGTVATARYPQLSVNLLASGPAALYWPLLDVAPDTMISLAGQTPDTMLELARGYTETLNGFTHRLVFNAAPGEPYLCPVFDDGSSRWAAGASSLAAGINATAVTMQVASTDGTLWTTTAGDFPLDIMMGGERITVGAITGTSSPQTFSSLTRSVNGVVKAHSASEAVDIVQPLYYALGR